MEINLSETWKEIISLLLLIILPLLVILLGVIFSLLNAWYYILAVTWFGMGIIFYSALND
jgi:hypothetical protein